MQHILSYQCRRFNVDLSSTEAPIVNHRGRRNELLGMHNETVVTSRNPAESTRQVVTKPANGMRVMKPIKSQRCILNFVQPTLRVERRDSGFGRRTARNALKKHRCSQGDMLLEGWQCLFEKRNEVCRSSKRKNNTEEDHEGKERPRVDEQSSSL